MSDHSKRLGSLDRPYPELNRTPKACMNVDKESERDQCPLLYTKNFRMYHIPTL